MARLLLLTITFLMLIGSLVSAQESLESDSYRVWYAIDPDSGIKLGEATDFLEALSNGVQEYEIELNFEQVDSCYVPFTDIPADVVGCVDFWDIPENPDIIPIFLPLRDLSPVLMPQGQRVWGLRNGIPAIVYATGHCDAAKPHLSIWAEYEDRTGGGIEGANYFLGNCALVEGRFQDAVQHFMSRGSIDSSAGGHYYIWSAVNAAWTYLQLGREDEAFKLMNRVLSDRGFAFGQVYFERADLPFVLTKRSQLYALAFRYDEAIADMNTAIELDPDNPALYVERGQRILLTYEWDDVLADYNHAIELDSSYAPAYFHRGVLFYTQGPRENALPDFQHYLELAPDGEFAEQAATYIEEIEVELAALDD
jgi:tetratricopeptide (TPR) repeat protein